ncbi:MAG: hypothetical protein ACW992_11175, partial [Candidatus Thorarchaeota archaeon]
VKIKRIAMGRKKQFPSESEDYGIGIRPEGMDGILVRVLHCKPSVEEGDTVEACDELGSIVRSRYFCHWTGAHYHVEIMNEDYFVRSTRSFELQNHLERGKLSGSFGGWPIGVEVLDVDEDFMVAHCPGIEHIKSGDLLGHAAFSGHSRDFGILDAGVAHYPIGGVLGLTGNIGDDVALWDTPIGQCRNDLQHSCTFGSNEQLTFMIDDTEIHGLSFFVLTKKQSHRGSPPVTLIPKKSGGFKNMMSVGDVLELSKVVR